MRWLAIRWPPASTTAAASARPSPAAASRTPASIARALSSEGLCEGIRSAIARFYADASRLSAHRRPISAESTSTIDSATTIAPIAITWGSSDGVRVPEYRNTG